MKRVFTFILMLSGFTVFAQTNSTKELWDLYNTRDFESVIDNVKPLLENEPGNAEYNLIVGRSYADLANFQNAVPYLEAAVKNDSPGSWIKAWALNYLGTCRFMLQQYEESKKALGECIALNATRNATNDAYGKSLYFGFVAFYSGWKVVETENFRFHFQNMNDDEIDRFTSVRKIAFSTINDFFKSTMPKKIDFFVWASREDAKRVLRANLGFARPEFCVVHSHYQQTPGHEMTHVISNYATDFVAKTRFINEGTAVCFDQTRQDRLKQIKTWREANNQQISIKDYWENGNGYAEEILYPVSCLFVEDLINAFGKDKFIEFFGNQTYENAKTIYGDELDGIIEKLEQKINL